MRLEMLGPMRVTDEAARQVTVTAPRQRTLLAALALHANQVVPAEKLAELVWDGAPPHGAGVTLRSYLRRLRTGLGPGWAARIVTHRPGYLCQAGEDEVDVLAFETLCRQATMAVHEQRWADASGTADRAVALWRDTPLLDVPSQALRDGFIPRLGRLRAQLLEDRTEAGLALGRHEQLLQSLQDLVAQHPLRERFRAQLMLALAYSGRRAEALAAYQDARTTLVGQLGVEPGPELRTLHGQILSGKQPRPAPEPSRGRAPLPSPTAPVPRQLPPAASHFTGRATQLAWLTALAHPADTQTAAGTVVISAIDGMAGIGKTTLAVHAAHQIADGYPDGQLFLDLHGYTHGVTPTEPGEALDRMLRLLGVAGEQIPTDLDERVGLYRSRLAGRRVLIVLDNAATEAQVLPLLPGAPGCLVLVTSRRRLSGLEHTHSLSLDTLPPHDAVALLRDTAGEARLAGQPADLAAELVELCGRLPLAIRIAAARLRSHPAWDLAHLVHRLRDQQHRLTELATGQRSVTAALDLSYQDLDTDLRHAYRLLGLHPGPDIDPYAAAALLDTTLAEADRTLEQLLDAHLLQEPIPSRYRFHDLTRAHAAHTATRDEPEDSARSALDRLLDHYRHTASLAMDTAYPHEQQRRPHVPPARTPSPDLPDPRAALQRLDNELPNL
ncbi:MAG: winged helix-turn-helix domain-containing protein, partial [Micromonosporaceae bacterium]|nr:winged helix-turn-helix domain-containing protein [Micromonosporaceae bacterium]